MSRARQEPVEADRETIYENVPDTACKSVRCHVKPAGESGAAIFTRKTTSQISLKCTDIQKSDL